MKLLKTGRSFTFIVSGGLSFILLIGLSVFSESKINRSNYSFISNSYAASSVSEVSLYDAGTTNSSATTYYIFAGRGGLQGGSYANCDAHSNSTYYLVDLKCGYCSNGSAPKHLQNQQFYQNKQGSNSVMLPAAASLDYCN